MGRSTIFVFVPNNWMKEVWDRALCFLPLFFFLRFLELGWKGCDERSLPFISGVAWKIVRNDCLAKSSGSVSKSARFGPLPSLPPLFFILFFSFFCFFSFFLIISSRSWQLLRATKRAGEQLLRVFFSVVVAVISIARARSFPSRIENGISRAVSEGWRSYVRCVVFFFFHRCCLSKNTHRSVYLSDRQRIWKSIYPEGQERETRCSLQFYKIPPWIWH